MINTLIVDDEAPARRRIKDLIAAESDFCVVGESNNVADALNKITSLCPSLLFLDIRMPGSTGFDLITRLGSENKPYIVFTTAHMNHALLAFEVGALDYLVKPIEQERFHLALGKMRNRISAAQAVLKLDADGTTRRTGESVAPAVHEPGRIAVHMGRALKILESQKITHVMAEGDYLDVHFSDGGCLKVRDRMHSFECRLASSSFLRIHRSILINKAHVSLIEPSGRGLIRVVLSDGTAFVSGAGFIDKVNLWLQQLQNPATAVN